MKISEFQIERYFAKYEFTTPYILCASDCESFTVEDILQLQNSTEKKLNNLKLGYTDSQGTPELRTAIANMYEDISKSDILAFSGAEEGIFIFMNVVLQPGDHIIVQFPAYQSLFEIALSIGCDVTKWTMDPKKDWDLDIDILKEHITSKTKGIVINFPHNPTGSLISQKKYQAIIDIAQENDLYLFSDEVYRFLEYSPLSRLPSACDLYEKAVSLGVMSKSFGLAGLRIGWIATKDQELLKNLAAFKDYTTICNSSVSEFLATIAIENSEKLVNRNLNIIRSNLTILDGFFREYNQQFDWIRPLAGPIAFPRIKLDHSIDEFCKDLVKQNGVLLLPGTAFDYGDKHFRIGFGRKNFPEALNALNRFINDLL